MKYLYYHYNSQGSLVLTYNDGYRRIEHCYVFYTLKEAIRKFRQEFNLQHKHITIEKLY